MSLINPCHNAVKQLVLTPLFSSGSWGIELNPCWLQYVCAWVLSPVQLFGLQPAKLLCPCNFIGKNTGVGCHFLCQGIFPSQGLNLHLLCLLHWRQILYPLEPLGKPCLASEFMLLTTCWHCPDWIAKALALVDVEIARIQELDGNNSINVQLREVL